ncbi:hypothetical protein EVAR_6585_1 [Eumeta japonica]|uniref:Uncharacterized protein n=1 Tax=Eumeta variegata TaxID=151549 RepID=A0A4C1SSU8_EUMVA|nr:hypothetical protein EVAR_6585_1 [Eumeta japonica]
MRQLLSREKGSQKILSFTQRDCDRVQWKKTLDTKCPGNVFFVYKRENKKGQLEVTLLYTASEDGLNDVIQVTVNRLRCSVATMQEQEQFKALLYLKATILEGNKSESYWKSDRFEPTISARWDPNASTVKLTVFKANLPKVSIYFSLGCKNKMAKKEILGKASIDEKSASAESWNECLRNPGIPKTFWINFE